MRWFVAYRICVFRFGFSFAALWVFRLRRAEAASALWIPHWHSEPFESQETRAAKGCVSGSLGERGKGEVLENKLVRRYRLRPVGSKKDEKSGVGKERRARR